MKVPDIFPVTFTTNTELYHFGKLTSCTIKLILGQVQMDADGTVKVVLRRNSYNIVFKMKFTFFTMEGQAGPSSSHPFMFTTTFSLLHDECIWVNWTLAR